MGNEPAIPQTSLETVRYPGSDQVVLSGRLSTRFEGNRRYLTDVYEKKKDWMLEPFRNRGKEWVLEPLRNRKQESSWAGEYAGKWLDAASRAAAGGKDGQLQDYVTAFAVALIETQEPDGYLGIELPAKRGGRSSWDVWNVKYAMTGLLTHYEVFRAKTSLEAAVRCGEWLIDEFGQVSGPDHPFFHSHEEGGVNVTTTDQLVRLTRLTGERKFLDFAVAVNASFPWFARMRTTHQALPVHAYTLMGCLVSAVEVATAAKQERELDWVERVWEDIIRRHLYPTGSIGYNELLSDTAPNDTPVENGQPARHHQETCATVEWLLLNARLYQATGRVRYVQKMEQTIYNALLAAQSIDGMAWMYFTPLRYEKRWFTGPTSCCYWSGPRGIARLPQWVYALDGEGIRVNLYEASEVNLRLDGCALAIKQSSLYPTTGKVTLRIQPERPLTFTLSLRIPFDAQKTQINVNGTRVAVDLDRDGYCPVRRNWSEGDQVEMVFDIPAAVHHFVNDQYGVIVRDPEVLSVDQDDNPALDLDEINLQDGVISAYLTDTDNEGRSRYRGEVSSNGQPEQVIFASYADCGGDYSRFRTAFPVRPIIEQ